MFRFQPAIKYAKTALDVDSKFYSAATLLAIIYALDGNDTESNRYAAAAVAYGKTPETIKQTIAYYNTEDMQHLPKACQSDGN